MTSTPGCATAGSVRGRCCGWKPLLPRRLSSTPLPDNWHQSPATSSNLEHPGLTPIQRFAATAAAWLHCVFSKPDTVKVQQHLWYTGRLAEVPVYQPLVRPLWALLGLCGRTRPMAPLLPSGLLLACMRPALGHQGGAAKPLHR